MKDHRTQCERLDALFRSRENQKIPLYEICGLGIAAYSRRIEELRAEYNRLSLAGAEDFLIINYTKREDGVVKSWYSREPRSGRPRWQPRHKHVQVTVKVQSQDTPWERTKPPSNSRQARVAWFEQTFRPKSAQTGNSLEHPIDKKADTETEPEWKLVP